MTGCRFASERSLHGSGLGGRCIHPVLSSSFKPLRAGAGEPLQAARETASRYRDLLSRPRGTLLGSTAVHRGQPEAKGTLLERAAQQRRLGEAGPSPDAKLAPLKLQAADRYPAAARAVDAAAAGLAPSRPLSPMIKPRATCSIDAETEVPEELFNALARLGKEVRRGGQHVLVARSHRNGGPRLVSQEIAKQLRSESTGRLKGLV